MYCDITICVDVNYLLQWANYEIVDKQWERQQDRSPEVDNFNID